MQDLCILYELINQWKVWVQLQEYMNDDLFSSLWRKFEVTITKNSMLFFYLRIEGQRDICKN